MYILAGKRKSDVLEIRKIAEDKEKRFIAVMEKTKIIEKKFDMFLEKMDKILEKL